MGIHGLQREIERIASDAITIQKIIPNQNFSLDVFITVYADMRKARKNNGGDDPVTLMGNIKSHVDGAYERILKYISCSMNTFWVFDGAPPEIKSKLLFKRREDKKNAQIALDILKSKKNICSDSDMIQSNEDNTDAPEKLQRYEEYKYSKKTVNLSREMIKDIEYLLQLFGIPYIEAISEAEMQCAVFRDTHKTISNDWDTLVFGGSHMVRFINYGWKTYEQISLSTLLDRFGFTHEQFVEFCILLGCDYCPVIKGLTNIYDEYKKYLNITVLVEKLQEENIRLGFKKYKIPRNYLETFNEAKNFYLHGDAIDPTSTQIQYKWKKPKVEEIVTFLVGKFDFNEDVVRRDMAKIMNRYNEYASQS